MICKRLFAFFQRCDELKNSEQEQELVKTSIVQFNLGVIESLYTLVKELRNSCSSPSAYCASEQDVANVQDIFKSSVEI